MSKWSDEAERVYHEPPRVTPEREAAWQRWIDDYAFSCAQRWVGQGTDEQEALDASLTVLEEWERLDGVPWMPLGTANVTVLASALKGAAVEQPEERAAYMLAIRTRATATRHELVLATAYQLGVSPQQARKMVARAASAHAADDPKAGKTAVYRYYDADGVLLYVGITKNADLRDDQHRQASGWHPLTVRRELDWFDTRVDAAAAEREAIRGEEPLFNNAHANESTKVRAIEYLLSAVVARAAS